MRPREPRDEETFDLVACNLAEQALLGEKSRRGGFVEAVHERAYFRRRHLFAKGRVPAHVREEDRYGHDAPPSGACSMQRAQIRGFLLDGVYPIRFIVPA
jgi:hypothetical protein